ncbi:MAG: hypothetical protein IKK82_02935 [Kiritimatiellae bacterium]|nr:hypothetical protein [Kiritimatiellia bacterium]
MPCSIAQRKAQKWFAPCGKRFLRARNTVLAYVRPRESEIRFRLAWSTDKKKSPRRNAEGLMKYFLRQQKSAPFPTRKWLHGLYFLPIAKSLFLEKQGQTHSIHRQNPHQWQSN